MKYHTKQFTQWGNYYTYTDTVGNSGLNQSNPSNICSNGCEIGGGFGKINLFNKTKRCNYSNCSGNNNAIKPYYWEECDESKCEVTMTNVIGNYGNIVGGIVMKNDARNACGFNTEWSRYDIDDESTDIKRQSVAYLGSKICELTETKCLNETQICIDEHGKNCQHCGVSKPGNVSCTQTNKGEDPTGNDAPCKPTTCCISEFVNPDDPNDEFKCYSEFLTPVNETCATFTTQEDCEINNPEQYCFWKSNWEYKNFEIIQSLGATNSINYFCNGINNEDDTTCPVGSENLYDVQKKTATINYALNLQPNNSVKTDAL